MDDYCMTREQAEEEMQQFQKIFSVVRIIGLEQLQLLAEGKAKELDVSPCRCYDFWKRGEACRQLCIPSGISREGSVLQAGISGFGNLSGDCQIRSH